MRSSPRLDDVSVAEPTLDAVHPRRLERMRERWGTEPLAVRVEVRDMVAVVVGDEDVGDREPESLHGLEDGLHRPARIDQHGVPAGPVTHDVAVRQPAGRHRALEDHSRTRLSTIVPFTRA